MKIVSINRAPTVCDASGAIHPTVISLDAILNHIDTSNGRNDALRAYICALRDLQVAHNNGAYGVGDDNAIGHAKVAVAAAFDRLIVAEFSLNRPATVEHLRNAAI